MNHLNQIFAKLNLTRENGLFITSENKWQKQNKFSNRVERLIGSVIKPNAFFSIDNKPIILFFENPTDKKAKLKQAWNFNEAPVVFIVEKDLIEIYNGFSYEKHNKSFQLFGKSNKLNDFEYFKLVTGKTWDKYKKDLSYNNRVDYHLLNNIKEARRLLINSGLKIQLANSLIGKIIFIRYLIDREVKLNFKGISRYWSNEDLCQLLHNKRETKAFFTYLTDKFNGNLFPIENESIDKISSECYEILIRLLQGDEISTGQVSLFDLYDFSIIPVEFISNVYELFIGQEKQEEEGAYYTPLFVVDYILAETIDKKFQENKNTVNCKVLDPACGSGVFLVESLRKIIEQYQYNNLSYSENSQKYKKDLKQLAIDNIFGIDKDRSAVEVAIFSIYLTLLDYQKPSDIETFQFPILFGENFFVSDFFDTTSEFNEKFKKIEFDFVLGNPPWKRGKGEGKKPKFVQYIEERKKNELTNHKNQEYSQIAISNREIAQAFVFRTSDFSNPNTQCSLIVTSKALYNLNGKKFRRYLLDRFFINKVFELAPVRREVFDKSNDKAISPAAILFFQYANGESTTNNIVEHITLKPSQFFSLFKVFTVQRNDYKEVVQRQLIEHDYLWKILVYGSYLDFNLIKRIKAEYAEIKEVISHGSKYIVKQGIKRKDGNKKIDVKDLVGWDFLDLRKKEINQYLISPTHKKWTLDTVGYIYREDGEVAKEMFTPPVLLIKETVNTKLESIAAISKQRLLFTDKVTAVKNRSGEDDKNYYNLAALLNSSMFSYFIAHTGSATGIMIEQQIHDKEKFSFPYVDNEKFRKEINKIEAAGFEGRYQVERVKQKLDDIVFRSFNLNDIESSIIEYTLQFTIPLMMRYKGYKKVIKSLPWENREVNTYINLFLNRFNPIHESRGLKLVVEIKYSRQIIGLFFTLAPLDEEKESVTWTDVRNDDIIQTLLSLGVEGITDKLFVQKDVRGFEEDGFYIIKPNEARLWHKAIAYLDLNEFVDAILKTGRKQLVNV